MARKPSQLQDDINRYLDRPGKPGKADEALEELEIQELMSASHVFTSTDKRIVEIINEQLSRGVNPRWDDYPAGTRRYRLFMSKLQRR